MPIMDHIPKSLLCKFFAANQCERGTACTFAHSLDELNHIPEQDLSRKEGKFNAWDGDLSPAGLIPNVRECTTTMSWAIWCLKNERTVPDWVPKLCLQAIVQHGAPFLSQMQEVLQPGPTQEQEVPKPEATTQRKRRRRRRQHRSPRRSRSRSSRRRLCLRPQQHSDSWPLFQEYSLAGRPVIRVRPNLESHEPKPKAAAAETLEEARSLRSLSPSSHPSWASSPTEQPKPSRSPSPTSIGS